METPNKQEASGRTPQRLLLLKGTSLIYTQVSKMTTKTNYNKHILCSTVLKSRAHLISGAQSGVWYGRTSSCTYMCLFWGNRSEGSSGSCHRSRSHTVLQQKRRCRRCPEARCLGSCINIPLLKTPGQAGRPTVNHRRETMEEQDHHTPATSTWSDPPCQILLSWRVYSNARVPCGAVHAGESEEWWDSSYGLVVSCERQSDGCSTRWRTTWTSPPKIAAGKGTYGLGWRCLGTHTHICTLSYFQILYLLSGNETIVVMQMRGRMRKWHV